MGSAFTEFTDFTDFTDLTETFFLPEEIWGVLSQILLILLIYSNLFFTRRDMESGFTGFTDFTDSSEVFFYQTRSP